MAELLMPCPSLTDTSHSRANVPTHGEMRVLRRTCSAWMLLNCGGAVDPV